MKWVLRVYQLTWPLLIEEPRTVWSGAEISYDYTKCCFIES
jgi:hypothetical protein